MSFDALPNESLLSVLEHNFTLPELLSYRLVSARWNAIILLICNKRDSLKLLLNVNEYIEALDWYGFEHKKHMVLKERGRDDEIVLRPLTEPNYDYATIATCLSWLFPNITHLVLQLQPHSRYNLQFMASLLGANCWPSLQSLTLLVHFKTFTDQPTPGPLFTAINSLSSLRRFDFYCLDSLPDNCRLNPVIHLNQILPKLEHFSLYCPVEERIVGALKHLGPNLQSLDINLQYRALLQEPMEQNVHVQAIRQLRLLNLNENALLESVVRCFANLEILELRFAQQHRVLIDSYLFNQLGQLEHLTEIRLHNVFINNFDLEMIGADIHRGTLRPILHVKRLEMTRIRTRQARPEAYNGQGLCQALAAVLPNVEELTLRYDFRDHFGVPFVRQIEQYLHHFPKLTKRSVLVRQTPSPLLLGRHTP